MVAKDELEPIRGTHPQWNIPHLCKGESRARLRTIWKKQPAERVIQRKETRTFTNFRFVPSEGHSPQWTRPRGSSPISSTFNSSRMQNTERNINGATHLLLTQRHGGHKEKDEHRLRESKRCGATHRLLFVPTVCSLSCLNLATFLGLKSYWQPDVAFMVHSSCILAPGESFRNEAKGLAPTRSRPCWTYCSGIAAGASLIFELRSPATLMTILVIR
jgi:hypothetical protein